MCHPGLSSSARRRSRPSMSYLLRMEQQIRHATPSPARTLALAGARPRPGFEKLLGMSSTTHSPFATIDEALEDIRAGQDGRRLRRRGSRERGRPHDGGEFVTPEADELHGHARPRADLPVADAASAATSSASTSWRPRTSRRSRRRSRSRSRRARASRPASRRTTARARSRSRSTRRRAARPRPARPHLPAQGRAGGVLERAGQTEAAVDLARLAGLQPGRRHLRDHERGRHDGPRRRPRRRTASATA